MRLTSAVLLVTGAGLVAAAPKDSKKKHKDHRTHKPTWSHPGYQSTGVYSPPVVPTQTFYNGSHGITKTVTLTSTSTATATPGIDACGSVARLSASYLAANPTATAVQIPAQVGYDCLNLIPFNQSAAVDLVNSIEPYLNWQTTTQWLPNPPADYAEFVQPPYDFRGVFEGIKAKVAAGDYENEYAFAFALYKAFQNTHDGHFVYYPNEVNGLIAFGRTTPLVSVSIDGRSAPLPYFYADVLAASFNNGSFTPSAIVEINGQEATSFLANLAEIGSLQDPDALYNNLFYSPAQVALGSSGTGTGAFSGGGRGRWAFPGASTSFKLANGTSLTVQNYARPLVSFANVTTVDDIIRTYLDVPPEAYDNMFEIAASASLTTATSTATATGTAVSSSAARTTAAATSTPAPGYPTPLYRHSQNFDSSYFLQGAGYEDVVVIAANSFVGSTGQVEFQQVIQKTITAAKAANKTKLIIDVSANGGGTILLGYDFFTQLFPSIFPYGANRFRAHEALNLIGEQDSYLAGLFLPRSENVNQTVLDIESSAFNYRTDIDVNAENFPDWAAKYGPFALGPLKDTYTNLVRWNLSDVLTPENSGGIYVSGYGPLANYTTQPFAPEDIIVVYDGYCASTCTIFSELLRQQAGIKTIALGGRSTTNITQAVGGVKGTNDFPWDYILDSFIEVYSASNASLQESWRSNPILQNYTQYPLYRATNYVVNARDGFRPGSDTPLQFVYEPAECRVLYTPQMVIDQSEVWRTVADTVWGDGDACVAGSNDFYPSTKRRRSTTTQEKRAVGHLGARVDQQAIWDSFTLETDGTELTGAGFMPL